MSKTMAQLTISLVVLIIGTSLGVLVEKYRTREETEIRYLEYRIDLEAGFLPTLPGKKIEIRLDGESIDNLSWLSIEVYNWTDRDFEEVPLYIDLVPRDGSALSVVSRSVYGPGDTPEAFQEIERVSSPPGTIRLGYRVEAMNRMSSPVFRAIFFLRGKTFPYVNIFAQKKGLDLRRLGIRKEYEGASPVPAFLLSVLVFGLVFGGFGFVAARMERRKILKRDEELMNHLTLSLSDDKTKEVLKLGVEADTSRLASYFVRTLQRFRWEKVPAIFKPFSSCPPPQDPK